MSPKGGTRPLGSLSISDDRHSEDPVTPETDPTANDRSRRGLPQRLLLWRLVAPGANPSEHESRSNQHPRVTLELRAFLLLPHGDLC